MNAWERRGVLKITLLSFIEQYFGFPISRNARYHTSAGFGFFRGESIEEYRGH
jgi:hypothetical protein